jgi:putative ABC transport system substrate-binding protein
VRRFSIADFRFWIGWTAILLFGIVRGISAWPLPANAQQAPKVARIGVLLPGAPPDALLEALRGGLRELGYTEGQNITFEVRYAEGKLDRLPALAAELVHLRVDIITTISTPAALAAKQSTGTIPIVFTAVGDPVGAGVVESLARPGGNLTGMSLLATELSGKRLELLREAVPNASRVAMLWNSTNPGMFLRAREAEAAAKLLGMTLISLGVHDLDTFDSAFARITRDRPDALLTLVDPFTRLHRKRIVEFAAQHHLPEIYEAREFADAGGLMAYGPSLADQERRAATYIDKILRGAKPSELPAEQPTKIELVINLKTAKALGLTIPQPVLLRADEVVQ